MELSKEFPNNMTLDAIVKELDELNKFKFHLMTRMEKLSQEAKKKMGSTVDIIAGARSEY